MTLTLTRHIIPLDPRHPLTRQSIGDVHLMHTLVMDGFAPQLSTADFIADAAQGHPQHRAEHNILHVIEPRPNGDIWLMVQATTAGNWDNTRLADALTAPVSTQRHTPATDGWVRYRIVLSAAHTDSKTRRRRSLRDASEVEQWWRNKTPSIGLDVANHRVDLVESHELRAPSKKGAGSKLRINAHTLTGAATVTDASKLLDACTAGVGRSRAYGCGLLLTLPGR